MRVEKSCGIIPYRRTKDGQLEFLIVKHTGAHWSFPKGHVEGGETDRETALRELSEETGIHLIKIADSPIFETEYEIPQAGDSILKKVQLFLGEVTDDPKLMLAEGEIEKAEWCTLPDALLKLQFANTKELLIAANAHVLENSLTNT